MGPPSGRPDSDGVRVTDAPGLRRAAWVLFIVTMVIGSGTFLIISLIRRGEPKKPADIQAQRPPEPTSGVGRPSPAPEGAPVPAAARPATASNLRTVRRDTSRSETAGAATAPEASPPREISAKEMIETLNAGGVHTGIAAFPPPGTKPVKRGIVVPDDFELPEGYVRHYQTTDDGNQLPAILTLHPDYDLMDAKGERVVLPDDRVVPPELAPSGLPVRVLELPDASDRTN